MYVKVLSEDFNIHCRVNYLALYIHLYFELMPSRFRGKRNKASKTAYRVAIKVYLLTSHVQHSDKEKIDNFTQFISTTVANSFPVKSRIKD